MKKILNKNSDSQFAKKIYFSIKYLQVDCDKCQLVRRPRFWHVAAHKLKKNRIFS